MSKIPELVTGGLYASPHSDGTYSIIKVLVIDDFALHLRTYANRFKTIPYALDPAQLTLGSLGDDGGFGIGHFPVSHAGAGVEDWVFLMQQPVLHDELDGYRIWAGIDSVG